MDLMTTASLIGFNQRILSREDPFWKFSDTALESINELSYLLVATGYPLLRNLDPVNPAPNPWNEI
jgi:hypothetical protein